MILHLDGSLRVMCDGCYARLPLPRIDATPDGWTRTVYAGQECVSEGRPVPSAPYASHRCPRCASR